MTRDIHVIKSFGSTVKYTTFGTFTLAKDRKWRWVCDSRVTLKFPRKKRAA